MQRTSTSTMSATGPTDLERPELTTQQLLALAGLRLEEVTLEGLAEPTRSKFIAMLLESKDFEPIIVVPADDLNLPERDSAVRRLAMLHMHDVAAGTAPAYTGGAQ